MGPLTFWRNSTFRMTEPAPNWLVSLPSSAGPILAVETLISLPSTVSSTVETCSAMMPSGPLSASYWMAPLAPGAGASGSPWIRLSMSSCDSISLFIGHFLLIDEAGDLDGLAPSHQSGFAFHFQLTVQPDAEPAVHVAIGEQHVAFFQ